MRSGNQMTDESARTDAKLRSQGHFAEYKTRDVLANGSIVYTWEDGYQLRINPNGTFNKRRP